MPDLAKKLVAHEVWDMSGFGWQPGTVDAAGDVVNPFCDPNAFNGSVPDIRHPATKGILLDQCRRMAATVWPGSSDRLTVYCHDDDWWMDGWELSGEGYSPTEGETIAKAWLYLADMYIAKMKEVARE